MTVFPQIMNRLVDVGQERKEGLAVNRERGGLQLGGHLVGLGEDQELVVHLLAQRGQLGLLFQKVLEE